MFDKVLYMYLLDQTFRISLEKQYNLCKILGIKSTIDLILFWFMLQHVQGISIRYLLDLSQTLTRDIDIHQSNHLKHRCSWLRWQDAQFHQGGSAGCSASEREIVSKIKLPQRVTLHGDIKEGWSPEIKACLSPLRKILCCKGNKKTLLPWELLSKSLTDSAW